LYFTNIASLQNGMHRVVATAAELDTMSDARNLKSHISTKNIKSIITRNYEQTGIKFVLKITRGARNAQS
jgi:hypothetical protein